jgi:hypothetical protein
MRCFRQYTRWLEAGADYTRCFRHHTGCFYHYTRCFHHFNIRGGFVIIRSGSSIIRGALNIIRDAFIQHSTLFPYSFMYIYDFTIA